MKTPKLLAVVGTKKSGKTTVAECLISGLTEKGLRVASIKHIHDPDFTMDREGTDTSRHANAGSRVVAAVSKKGITVMLNDDPERMLEPVLDFMARQDIDVIVIEGLHSSIGRRSDVFKIVTGHDAQDLHRRLHETVPPILAISGVVTQRGTDLSDLVAPAIDSKSDCRRLVELVEENLVSETHERNVRV